MNLHKKAFIPGIGTVFTGILFLAIALFAVVMVSTIMGEERTDRGCETDWHYNGTLTYPNQCCLDETNCTITGHFGALNEVGETVYDSIAGLSELPERSDTLVTVGVIGLILAALVGVGLLAKRMS